MATAICTVAFKSYIQKPKSHIPPDARPDAVRSSLVIRFGGGNGHYVAAASDERLFSQSRLRLTRAECIGPGSGNGQSWSASVVAATGCGNSQLQLCRGL